MAKTVLGRGLSALITNKNNIEETLKRIDVTKISPNPNQPRKFFQDDRFQELVVSVKQFGVLQPLIVRKKDKNLDSFELIAGERRYRAALKAGVKQLPVVVKKVRSDIEGFELALIENIQRQDLNPIEEAKAFCYLLDDCKISQAKLGKTLGKSRSYIANSVRLLGLCKNVQQMVTEGTLSAGHARNLVSLQPKKQEEMAKKIINETLSVRQTEAMVSDKPLKQEAAKENNNLKKIEEAISAKNNLKVQAKSKNNKGYIKIYFNNEEEFQRITEKLI